MGYSLKRSLLVLLSLMMRPLYAQQAITIHQETGPQTMTPKTVAGAQSQLRRPDPKCSKRL